MRERHTRRRLPAILLSALLLSALAGCVVVPSRGAAPSPAGPPAAAPRVEHTAGAFTFALGGGDPAPSNFDGHRLSDELMCVWQRRGYVDAEEFVDQSAFSNRADFNLTLTGSQHNDTSLWPQILNALTLTLVPYSVTQHYDLQYELENVHNGRRYTATVQGADRTYVGILLLAGLPMTNRGHREVVARMSDDLYDQFVRQGAFGGPDAVPPLAATEDNHDR